MEFAGSLLTSEALEPKTLPLNFINAGVESPFSNGDVDHAN